MLSEPRKKYREITLLIKEEEVVLVNLYINSYEEHCTWHVRFSGDLNLANSDEVILESMKVNTLNV